MYHEQTESLNHGRSQIFTKRLLAACTNITYSPSWSSIKTRSSSASLSLRRKMAYLPTRYL